MRSDGAYELETLTSVKGQVSVFEAPELVLSQEHQSLLTVQELALEALHDLLNLQPQPQALGCNCELTGALTPPLPLRASSCLPSSAPGVPQLFQPVHRTV